MQLLFYSGAGHPLAMLPNLDWYIGMMLVYSARLCTKKPASGELAVEYATIKQRHVFPIAVSCSPCRPAAAAAFRPR